MKLKLHCKTHDGKQEDWIYDNVTNEIWNSNGDLVDLSKDERLKPYAMTKQRGKPSPVSNHKSNEIWNLKIQLGLKCNMHCKYCAQTGNEIGASLSEMSNRLSRNSLTIRSRLLAQLNCGVENPSSIGKSFKSSSLNLEEFILKRLSG